MTRAQAKKKFLEVHQEEREALRKEFLEDIPQKMEDIVERIFSAFEEIKEAAEEKEKKDCVHFLFGLQRCDLLKNKAIIRLDVMNPAWYMDEEGLTVQMDFTFLFQPYFAWKEKLMLDIRKERGKVNQYDVEHLVQEEILVSHKRIAHFLRFAFRNLEQKECFRGIGKMPYWIIRWGEYKDESEIVLRVNREEHSQKRWLEKLEKYRENKDILKAEFWYRTRINEGDCRKKQMHFITFEECTLRGIDFGKAGLSGARFIRCKLDGCDFSQADLKQADFEDCQFAETVFSGADLFQATFSQKGFPWETFEQTQLEQMLLVREEGEKPQENEKGGR